MAGRECGGEGLGGWGEGVGGGEVTSEECEVPSAECRMGSDQRKRKILNSEVSHNK